MPYVEGAKKKHKSWESFQQISINVPVDFLAFWFWRKTHAGYTTATAHSTNATRQGQNKGLGAAAAAVKLLTDTVRPNDSHSCIRIDLESKILTHRATESGEPERNRHQDAMKRQRLRPSSTSSQQYNRVGAPEYRTRLHFLRTRDLSSYFPP